MQTSLPYLYPQSYPCGYFLQPADSGYNTHAYQYPLSHQAFVDWHSPPHYYGLSHTQPSSRLRFHMPSYMGSQSQHGWSSRRGRPPSVHAISRLSPPALTRCVSTLSSPFTGDQQLTAGTIPTAGTVSAPGSHVPLSTSVDVTSTLASSVQNSTTLSSSRFLKWLDCAFCDQLLSDNICRSLVDTSQRPAALNDAICMYIDYLSRDNDRVIGEWSVIAADDDDQPLDNPLSTLSSDQLYRDLFCQPSSFPTSRFREWLQVYSVDLEITDPNGRKLTEAKFPGCGCQTHQVADNLMSDLTAIRQNLSVPLMTQNQSMLPADINNPTPTSSRRHMTREMYSGTAAPRCRRGRGRGGRRAGRARHASTSSHDQPQQSGNITDTTTSNVQTECHDDSAVVEFLASLQSDAALRRRSRQQQQQQVSCVEPQSRHDDKVIEEVVDDEFPVVCDDHQPLSVLPMSQSASLHPASTMPQFTNSQFVPVSSSPTVGSYCCSTPVKVASDEDPADVVGKSSEQ